MTVYQPDYDYLNFEIMVDPDIEVKYKQILNHRYNNYSRRMAPTFADQQMGQGDYVVVFNDDEPSATIQPRTPLSLDDRLEALRNEL